MMHRMILLVVGFLGLASVGSAQIVQNGQCSGINLMQNFVLNTFATGTWYEIGKATSQNAACSNLQFTINTDNTIAVSNPSEVNNFLQTSTGTATHTTGTAQMTLTLAGSATPFWILGTDYNNYTIAISCVDTSATQRQLNIWQLGRATNSYTDAAVLTAANNLLNPISLSVSDLQAIDHSTAACTQLPVIPDGQPVILDGQCATSAPTPITAFNVANFAGTWHQISSYYSANAVGTCARADYTLVGTTVNVVNSQVLNQRLDQITGTATLVGTDGSGRLSVTLNVQGVPVTQELLILATDYAGYAISYSCNNISPTQRQVNAWILSRTRQISAPSQTAVNNFIASVVDLNTEYLRTTDQSDNGCFYFPEHQVGRPVLFPGSCHNAIAAMPNFNLAQFNGTWHEIEAYPKEQQTGSCVNHEFSASTATSLNLISNQVVNQQSTSATGSVTLVSTDGSGRLSLTLTTGGQNIEIPFWVLATDYTNYTLAYSCVDQINNGINERAVYSWKLSRTQTLTTADNTAINTAMAAVQVLSQDYFETVDQTDNGCFYFPSLVENTPVVFPGLCNSNIPVQPNFDPVAYMGLWHDIESYPSPFQQGTCSNAYYTLVEGIVDVFNTQVINQRLDTINGTAVIPDPNEPAKLVVTFPVVDTDLTTTTNYWVLSTDYASYSLVYSCTNVPDTNERIVFGWKLSRDKAGLSAAANTAINAVTANIPVLDERYFLPRDQTETGCFYFPEALGQPVVFPGLCSNTISAVENFDLNQFIGTWHEIEAYPKEQQTGSCVNHEFSASTATSLNLISNQVVNQQATSATGSVTLVSTDGSGRLSLTLTTGGQNIEIPFWVLATDYTNYTLAYSCVDQINNGINERAVYSWKLSRTQTLTTADNTAINTAMAAVQVLSQDYFETVDQTDNGCFYFPSLVENTPVVFPGLCNSNIPVQPNFDPVAYMGLWHDIESYPSPFQQGTCSNAYYTLVEGIVDVFNTQVINQRLDTINGTAVIPDPNEPAKLVVTFPVVDTDLTTTTNYWVLSTDYASYSLVYSCTNVPDTNERIVFGWKLSRDKAGLSAAANTAINAVTANIPVLDERYFLPRDQTETGCFYFPEALGQPVVFPGLCSNTINAVANFDLNQFIGTWHEIEAYPKEQQTGSCVNHEFSASTATSLNLISNQVVNQQATSADGNVTLASTDASGRFTLSISVDGQVIVIPYWILATDYTSYALAYSCVQLNPDFRAVYSWKLGRNQTFTAAANTAINTAMAAVDVLDQQYFEPVDQSPDGCRAYPIIPAGDPIIYEGQCGTVNPVTNFLSAAFTGTWYEAARFASARQTGNCAASQFNATAANTFTLTQTIVYNERQTVVSGTATLPNDGSGTLTATFTDGAALTYTTTIHILDTDYVEFALLYSCENVPGTNNRQIFSWKLSRFRTGFSQVANDRMSQVVANNDDLFEGYYQTIGQTNDDCFHYPVFEETPEAIVLPGPCPAVNGVPNFSPTDYSGHWYDVARYPIATQSGTCPRAEYSALVNGVVTIRNLMVVNNELRVQTGIARPSATGTGLLEVTFDGEPVAQYHILGTDYVTYSLLYSCRNLEDGTRLVQSWKLSRSSSLTNAANTAINTIIGNTQGLLEEYYQTQSHTDQDCFYMPELVPGEPLLLSGRCGEVRGMERLDRQQYFGWWHEIERYPSERYNGHCSSINFEPFTTTLVDITEINVNNNVYNETTTRGDIMEFGYITIIRNNNEVETWYVIDTDYNTYSLLYSCEDVTLPTGSYRRVWSAKHSKQRSLTQAAQNAMAPHIQSHRDLHPDFFDTVDQSDSTCFYYTEDASQQVILPGQCNSTIPVQANFDVEQFAGTWYQIERYPYPQVSNDGTCVGSRYTVGGDGVTVLNWEVRGGTLNTVEGNATVNGATLTVTLPVENSEETVTTNLLILLTDYDNYALAYTCVNVDPFHRAVGAFKLSRARQLNNNAQAAINNYMATREELHQPYFISISHNDDCEEPSSALLVKSSFIVMLVCVVLQLVM